MTRSRLWTLGTAGVVVVVFLASYFLLISPKQSEAADLRDQADQVAATNLTTQAKIRELEALQENLPAQNARIEEIAQLIPAQPQLPDLIRQLTDAGQNASVDVEGIVPGALTGVPNVAGVVYIPRNLTATGTYTDVKQFIDELQRNRRAVLITDVAVRPAEAAASTDGAQRAAGPTELTVELTTRVYMTKETAAADPAAGAQPTAGATAAATPAASAPATAAN